ncbi:MAG: hypothetical protein V2A73_19565, partial [Pseudomonadota bacterium]
ELGTRNQELEQPPRYGSHLNRRPESRIKSIGWPPSIEQSPSTLRDTPTISRDLALQFVIVLVLVLENTALSSRPRVVFGRESVKRV